MQEEAEAALAEAEALKLQALAGGPDDVGEGKGQAEPKGLQDLQPSEMASWREGDNTRRSEGCAQEDGCSGSPPEGQGSEGEGAGDGKPIPS